MYYLDKMKVNQKSLEKTQPVIGLIIKRAELMNSLADFLLGFVAFSFTLSLLTGNPLFAIASAAPAEAWYLSRAIAFLFEKQAREMLRKL